MHHYQFTSAAAAAAAATYPNHQFYQHPEISHLDQNHSNHSSNGQLNHNQTLNQQSALDTHSNQWAQYTQQHQHQQQHHQHLHLQQQQQHHQQQQQLDQQHQQHQQSQHQQSQPSQQQNDQQQQMYQTHHHQSQQQQQQQHPNYYAVINALNGYHHHQQQQHHHHYHQDSQAQQSQQLHNQSHQHSAAQHYAASSSPPTNSNGIQKSIRDTTIQSSAINQLQAFALSAPEAAVAAAAVTFKPFYSSGSTQANHTTTNANQTTVATLIGASAAAGDGIRVTKIQKQRVAPKAKPIKRQQDSNATTINGNQRDNNNQQAPQTNLSRSQRRYAGRASCDCPNCIELERLKRHGLEPPADNGVIGEPVKKLMHVCHHAGCGKEYEKTSHLRAHLRWHTSERLSACRHSDCGKRFTRTDELRKHMKTHHSQPSANSQTTNKQAQQVKQQA